MKNNQSDYVKQIELKIAECLLNKSNLNSFPDRHKASIDYIVLPTSPSPTNLQASAKLPSRDKVFVYIPEVRHY